jgi:hypothetical protein
MDVYNRNNNSYLIDTSKIINPFEPGSERRFACVSEEQIWLPSHFEGHSADPKVIKLGEHHIQSFLLIYQANDLPPLRLTVSP